MPTSPEERLPAMDTVERKLIKMITCTIIIIIISSDFME